MEHLKTKANDLGGDTFDVSIKIEDLEVTKLILTHTGEHGSKTKINVTTRSQFAELVAVVNTSQQLIDDHIHRFKMLNAK